MKNSLLLCVILTASHGLQGKIIPETEFTSPEELEAYFERCPKDYVNQPKRKNDGSDKNFSREIIMLYEPQDENIWHNTNNILHTCEEALSPQNYKACEKFLRMWNKSFHPCMDGYAFRIGKKILALEDENPLLAQQSTIALNRTEALKESLNFSEEFSNSLENFYKNGRHFFPRHNGEKNEGAATRGLNIHEFWSLLHTCQSNYNAEQEIRDYYDGGIMEIGCPIIESFLKVYKNHLSPEELAKIRPELHAVQRNVKQAHINKLNLYIKATNDTLPWVKEVKKEIKEKIAKLYK